MKAFQLSEELEEVTFHVVEVADPQPGANEVLIGVEYSGINFKDAMVAQPKSRVRREPQLIGGVDAAGTVLASNSPEFPVGARVAAHGGVIGVARSGGYAEQLVVPVENVSLLPDSISTRDAMVIGTAGFTAMQSLLALENYGIAKGSEVLVTGATGGVGSQSLTYLKLLGYSAVASTGSIEAADWLYEQGANRIIGRDEITDKPERVLGPELWDAAIDCVGGATLWNILRSLKYGGAVAASGLVASAEFSANVYPFITRNVALLGVDSVQATAKTRQAVWGALGDVAPQINYENFIDEVVGFSDLPEALSKVHRGATRGRILVSPQE